MTVNSERDKYIEDSKVDILLNNLFSSMPATVLNSTILIIVLWPFISHSLLLGWYIVNTLFVLLRYAAILYDRKHKKNYSSRVRKNCILTSFIIAGLLFSLSAFFIFNIDNVEYIVFLYFISGGMMVGSLGSYHNNLDVHFSYSGTIFFIFTAIIYIKHTTISSPMAILGCVFYLTTSVLAIRLNKDLSESLILRFDNIQLVENLNAEKIQTERLNQALLIKNDELKDLSLLDPLTGLRNRRYLFEIVTPEIRIINKYMESDRRRNNYKRMRQLDRSYGIIMIDIDYFKKVNDNYGHDSGDLVLVQFAAKLVENVRNDDIICRIGGEEFTIILKDTTEEYLETLAENIRLNIEKSVFSISDEREISLTCSIGFIFYPFFKSPHGSITFEKIMSLADKGLYRAKEGGRNRTVRVYSPFAETDNHDHVEEIINDISGSVEKEQILFQEIT